jgi:phage terminase large subunit-like protein
VSAINQKTLDGWRAKPSLFIEEVLYDPETGEPFKLLPAERTFLAHAFQLNAVGKLLYPEQVYACPKKSGKTGYAALHTLTLLLLFGGPFAEGYCIANDLEQAVSRVFQAIKRIVAASPLLAREAKVTSDKITFPAFRGATITAIANDYTGAAGANPNISTFDEPWGITTERGHRLFDEMIPPPTRKIACRLAVSYAGWSGESVLLETLYKRGLQLPRLGPSLYGGDGLLMFWSHEPVAPWQDDAWLAEMRRSLRPNQYLRMIENRFVTSESSFVDMTKWDRCTPADARQVIADKSMYIWCGIDASTKHDSTAIVGVTYDRRSKQVRLVFHRVFQPTPDRPLQFEATIEATLRELAHRFQFRKIRFDPWQMMAVAQRLAAAGLPVEEFPQTSGNLTAASQNLYDLIEGGNIVLYPDAGMRLAASRAVAVETGRGWRISKEKQSHKIDVIVALAMAAHAAVQGSGEPYFDKSYSGFQPDAQDDKNNKPDEVPFAIRQFKDYVMFGRTLW